MQNGVTDSVINFDLSITGTNMVNMLTLCMPDGELRAYSIDKGNDGSFINMAASKDGGKTFGPPARIYPLDPAVGDWIWLEATVSKGGNIQFFLLNDAHTFAASEEKAKSRDVGEGERPPVDYYEGLSINIWHTAQNAETGAFTTPKLLFEGYVGSLNSCLTLSGGRILLPFLYYVKRVWASRGSQVSPYSFYGVCNCAVLYSDDEGETFQLSNDVWVPVPDIVSAYGAVEPVCYEDNQGEVEMVIRTQLGVFYRSHSKDGSHYGTPVPTTIINSDSPAGIVRLGKKTVIFYNSCKRYPYAYGGRHVLHAAVSDDDLKTIRGGREVHADPQNYAPPPPRGDYGTAYPYPCATADGKTLFATGQGTGRHVIKLLDPAWLEEKSHAADFKSRPMEWHHFGVGNISVDEGGVAIGPSEDSFEAAVWNFPLLHKGTVRLELETKGLASALKILLTDHFSTPFDEGAPYDCVFEADVPLADGRHSLLLEFDCDGGLLRVVADGKPAGSFKAWKRPRHGVNYLRVQTPFFADGKGAVRLTAARVDGG